jgi:two-component system chemotaxis sensor kinase CheA
MNDFLQQFLIESREFVTQAADGLLVLEKNAGDAETLDTVFRAFHTLKGGAGIVEFATMENALHSTESLLQDARAGRRKLDAAFISSCLASLDQVSGWLDVLERTGELPVTATTSEAGTVATLPRATSPSANSPAASPSDVTAAPQQDWLTRLSDRHPGALAQAATAFRITLDPECFYTGEDPIALVSSLSQLLALDIEPASPWPPLQELDPYACNLVLSGLTGAGSGAVNAELEKLSGDLQVRSLESPNAIAGQGSLPEVVRKVLQEQIAILDLQEKAGAAGRIAAAVRTAANALRSCGLAEDAETLTRIARDALPDWNQALHAAIARLLPPRMQADSLAAAPEAAHAVAPRIETAVRTLRVNAGQIDALVRLTGELTVAKNAIGHAARLAEGSSDSTAALLKTHHAQLARLVTQLQNSVIGMRVLPLSTVFQRFPRVLRDVSLSLAKPAQLKIEGGETEADKVIVETLFEPLLHVIRNALDHGIEDAEQRHSSGKPPVATLLLRAARDGEQILIEVSDDGRGIDLERIRRVARERGVADQETLRTMPDSEVIELVFAPGFSTAARVTEISGRGVGMDAVRAAVEKIGGRVSISSVTGQGTTVSFSLPYSVMMTQVMTVEAGGQLFGIPLDTVLETVSLPADALSGVGDGRVFVQRNRTIPIVDLGSVLHAVQENRHGATGAVTVIITAVAGQLVGLQVERVGERMDIILKPLEGLLSGTPGIAGTTVLGDGRVLLVLDISGIVQ